MPLTTQNLAVTDTFDAPQAVGQPAEVTFSGRSLDAEGVLARIKFVELLGVLVRSQPGVNLAAP